MTNLTQDQQALQAHIIKTNAEFRANVAARGGVVFCAPVEDVQFWIDNGINTVEEYERNQAWSLFYDMYKDVMGVRPRHYDFDKMTLADIEGEIAFLTKHQEYENNRVAELRAQEERDHKARKALNAYKPNNPFAGLKDLLAQS